MKHQLKWVGLVLIFTSSIFAQSGLEEKLSGYVESYAHGYIKPFATAFTSNLNSGLFTEAKVEEGLNIDLRLSGMFFVIGDDQKTFTAELPDPNNPLNTIISEEATIFGEVGDDAIFDDLSVMPLAAPTLTIGSFMGTEVSLRYLKASIDDVGDISLNGYGIRHDVGQYIPLFPLDVSVGFFAQKFSAGDLIESKMTSLHIELGYEILLFDVLAGFSTETATTDLHYTYENAFGNEEDIDFSFDTDQTRFMLGFGIDFWLFRLNTMMYKGDQTTYVASINIGI